MPGALSPNPTTSSMNPAIRADVAGIAGAVLKAIVASPTTEMGPPTCDPISRFENSLST